MNRWRWLLGVAVFGLPVAILAFVRLGTSESIDAVTTHVPPILTTPTARVIADERAAFAQVTVAEGTPLRAPAWNGTITSIVRPSAALKSGDRLATVSGVARIVLTTPEPFYRPLRAGDDGPDVAMLNAALLRLGYLEEEPFDPEGYGFATTAAVRKLAAELGVRDGNGAFDPGWVVWMPFEPFEIGELKLEAGAPAPSAGTVIATEPRRAVKAMLQPANPSESLSLDPAVQWVFASGTARLAIDPAKLEVSAGSLSELTKLLKADSPRVDGTVRRAQTLDVLAVPSTAVQAGAAGNLCVWVPDGDGFRAVGVKLAGARAGVTNVVQGLQPGQQLLANPVDVLKEAACPSPLPG